MHPIPRIKVTLFLIVIAGLYLRNTICINFTASAPRGLWKLVHEDNYKVGDWVIAKLPQETYNFACERGYLRHNMILKKNRSSVHGSHKNDAK